CEAHAPSRGGITTSSSEALSSSARLNRSVPLRSDVSMRIAQIAPVFESVPPARYGGTERVVHWLTEELLARGHEVVVFGSGDSTTRAELVAVVPRSLRVSGDGLCAEAMHLAAVERAIGAAPGFDVI